MLSRASFRKPHKLKSKPFRPLLQTNTQKFSFFSTTRPLASLENKNTKTPIRFFEEIRREDCRAKRDTLSFLRSQPEMRKFIYSMDSSLKGDYLIEHFISWLTRYSKESHVSLEAYLSDKTSLDSLSQDFINFCFKNGIFLDPEKTLHSFDAHNQLSDSAVKKGLVKIKPKHTINLLGYGLDEGHYEQSLAKYLIDQNIAQEVNLYGLDPFAKKSKGIKYISEIDLNSGKIPLFDVITARWVLHHVATRDRWKPLTKCINQAEKDAVVLIVEHGFLSERCSMLETNLYYLLNAIFDIVANIGLRPEYFTMNTPANGTNFFIHYLTQEDFSAIRADIAVHYTQEIIDVGPPFPNQTVSTITLHS